jgi:hypothetical protein
MSLSTVLFLFLAHLGVGIVFTLVLVSKDAGVKFFRFNAGLAAALIAVALAFRYGAIGIHPRRFFRDRTGWRSSRWTAPKRRSSCIG